MLVLKATLNSLKVDIVTPLRTTKASNYQWPLFPGLYSTLCFSFPRFCIGPCLFVYLKGDMVPRVLETASEHNEQILDKCAKLGYKTEGTRWVDMLV